ncbi:HNH endonuclease [Falsihalocynthiibacter arcticus]|uniref:HNH endonuclease n=1 Tax=Falsihalocynthiibacter arcticus TaxID=1579316 RepID=UPI003001E12E
MLKIEDALRSVSGEHLIALQWFNKNTSRRIAWIDIQEFSSDHSRLVNQAKGIYKPKYTTYALSVRTIQDGPYPDKEVEFRDDGSWVAQYFQENPDIELRDREATNRGLMRCMEDQVPVGFLVKRKPKPGVEYDVLGLGLVVSWEAGYFTIEGFSHDGRARLATDATDAALTRAQNSYPLDEDVDDFLAGNFEDLRAKTVAVIARRRGQAKFRASLLGAYDARCCATGCDLKDVLEAAHITPYLGEKSNHVQNGLLLRSDIHTLYDLGLLAINDCYEIILATQVSSSPQYKALLGQKISLPNRAADRPSQDALQIHREWTGLRPLGD